MRNLPREVVAAIETAVSVNNGALESAYIHALAKIYKTSPQAVVWNMKRWNKVQAGCDDRQKGGRPPVIDKDKAAEWVRDLVAESHRTGDSLKMDKIAELVSAEFGVEVSSTWGFRLVKQYNITYKEPKPPPPPKVKKVPKPPKAPKQPVQSGWVPQYNLPAPGQHPSFREDLQQAMGGGGEGLPLGPPVYVEPRVAIAPPPVLKIGRPSAHAPDFEGFGILKLGKHMPPRLTLPRIIPYQPHLQHSPTIYPRIESPRSPNAASSPANSTPNTASSSVSRKPANDGWEVLKVVELP